MVFSSNIFLFAFLPLFLALYYLLPMRLRSTLILIFSYLFYSWHRPEFLALLIGVTVVSYAFALALYESQDETKRFRLIFFGVALNLSALGYFKYWNFGVESFNTGLQALGFEPVKFAHVLLPIGLSFYIFHAISYLVDIYRKEAEPARDIIDFAAFIALFPHLVAGPVLTYHKLAAQFRSREHSWTRFSQASFVFMVGFCMKVLIADPIAPLVDAAFSAPSPTFADAWTGALAYTIQLFFDFAGYSTMAIGLALMIGFEFPENFNDPYVSQSITEFWKRWHMSLSSWLRDYLYISLGGNRKGVFRTYLNLFLTMLLGGLWHGANWTFVIWGAWHGGILAFERYWEAKFGPSRLPRVVRVAKTMLLVIVGWVIFRALNVGEAARMLYGMSGLNGFALSGPVAWQLTNERIAVMILGVALVYLMPAIRRRNHAVLRAAVIPLFIWAVATLSSQSFTPFLYFQF